MTQVKRPARLDIVDMPRDTTRALGGLRQALCASFNYCRKYPLKMEVLKQVLKYTYSRIVAWEKEYEQEQEAAMKVKLEHEAKQLGVDLDSRKSVENMQADLEVAKEAAKEASKQAKTEQAEEVKQSPKSGQKSSKSGAKGAESTK